MAEPFWGSPDNEGDTFLANPWDTLVMRGQQFPGRVEVIATPARKADTKSGAGVNGGRTTLQGYTPATVEIKVNLWTDDQWAQWQRVLAVIWPGPGKKDPDAFDVYHPSLAVLGIKACVVVSVGTPQPGDVFGAKVISLKAVEYQPPAKKKATHTPTAAEGLYNTVNALYTWGEGHFTNSPKGLPSASSLAKPALAILGVLKSDPTIDDTEKPKPWNGYSPQAGAGRRW